MRVMSLRIEKLFFKIILDLFSALRTCLISLVVDLYIFNFNCLSLSSHYDHRFECSL